MNDKLTLFTKRLLDIMFFSGIIVEILLPGIIYIFSDYNDYYRKYIIVMFLTIFSSGVMALLIISELRKIFKTVIAEDCFVCENVTRLNKMGNYSFVISAITVIRSFFYITPASIVIIIVFVVASLFSKVLACVFDKAVAYKLENDMTV